ncbi:FxLYD domain-containing protein [Patescibacteria group bacterium]|nr:FxLYD domain-containing protein [Patescibacteria group bacterium]MDE1946392.1 FxLYD domain-containing protein [Patescibacteria group bacterium]MDE2011272.1 FxLYD domain-containing protein [Patescibacteria group bacterium]MDE2233024.1 FxLYD domain-containing protein [Patescibacteria group bacterium]
MVSWAKQRKLLYGGGVIIILLVAIAVPAWKVFYKAPSCFDGIKDGNETGVDCGGSCVKLCPSAFLTPVTDWTRFEEVAPGLYNIATYIENPNIDGEAFGVPYHVQLYDNRGVLIVEYDGTVTLPPHRNVLAFQGAVNTGQRVPSKALFEFTGIPNWHKQADRLVYLSVTDKQYREDETGSALTATLKNNGVLPVGRISVYVVLYDKNNNAIGFSKTIIDSIAAGATVTAPFTWPVDRHGAVVSIEVLPVAE